jgi:type I restriction enzyme S subunit
MTDEWEAVRLGDLLTPVSRPTPVPRSGLVRTLGVRWYASGCFAKEGDAVRATQLNSVSTDDIVYSRLFAWKGSFGVVPPELDGVLASNEFPTYRADERRLLPDYFRIWSSRPSLWSEAEDASTGTTGNSRKRLGVEDFLSLEVELPPLAEQQKIIRAVSLVERAESEARQLATASMTAYQAAAEEWIDGEPVPLAELVVGIDAGVSPKCLPRAPGPNEYGVLKTASVRHGRLFAEEAKALPADIAPKVASEVRPGDLLTIRASGSRRLVGALCLVPDDVPPRLLMSDYHWRIRLADGVVPAYLLHATITAGVRAQIDDAIAGSTTAGKISRDRYLTVEVPLPSAAEQADVASRLQILLSSSQAAEAKADSIRDVQRALTEELLGGGMSTDSM